MKRLATSFTALLVSVVVFSGVLNAQPVGYSPGYQAEDKPLADMLDLQYDSWKKHQTQPSLEELRSLNTYGFSTSEVPEYSGEVIEQRLKKLNYIIPMDYNPVVKHYIDFYTKRYRPATAVLLGRSKIFFPVFERILEEEGVPQELKYLSVIESALKPEARSWAGAVGLWQFMYGTGKMMNLKINSYVDERHDPEKSCRAAARYLKSLYDMYGDWLLAIGSYNCGPGNMNRAIRLAQERKPGPKTYWEVAPYLPTETRGYVPGFIGAIYAMHYAAEHNLYPTYFNFSFDVDEIKIVRQKLNLKELAQKTGTDYDELRMLNPELKLGVVPYTEEPYTLRVPTQTAIAVRNALKDGALELDGLQTELASAAYQETHTLVYHTVQQGEKLEAIAAQYKVSPEEILKWNKLWGYNLSAGLVLKIQAPLDKKQYYTAPPPRVQPTQAVQAQNNTAAAANTAQYYHVRSGDTLYKIAVAHNTTIAKICELNGISRNALLQINQKLRVR